MPPRAASPDDRAAGRAHAATAVVFLVNGALIGSWVPRIPAIRDHVGATTGPLGVALLGIALGALASKQLAGPLVARFGSAPITRLGIAASCAALPLSALAGSVVTLGLALIALGAAMGVLDVAMNAHAVALEARRGRAILSSLHGSYSVGGLAGAALGGWAGHAGLAPLPHLALAGAVLAAVALAASAALLPPGPERAPAARRQGGFSALPRDHRIAIVALGIVALCGMAGEGAAGDWSAIYLRDDLGAGPGLASAGYAAYSIAMACGRFLGDRAVTAWGGLAVLRRGLALAGGGFALGLVARDPRAAIAGLAALGLGLSVVVPVVFSTAGRIGERRLGPTIGVVSSIAGAGMFASPPLIGGIAELTGLPVALGLVSALAFTGIALLRLVQPLATSSSPDPAAPHG